MYICAAPTEAFQDSFSSSTSIRRLKANLTGPASLLLSSSLLSLVVVVVEVWLLLLLLLLLLLEVVVVVVVCVALVFLVLVVLLLGEPGRFRAAASELCFRSAGPSTFRCIFSGSSKGSSGLESQVSALPLKS